MNFLYILGAPLGYVMEWIYKLIPNYGWDIILFTLVVRLVSLPLAISQQKTQAKMSVFQPMLNDLQKKYKNDQEKYQQELMKLQQDYGYNPTSGCLPMALNFFVIFGVIEVVYRPLQHMLHIAVENLNAAQEVLTGMGISTTTVTRDGTILSYVANGAQEIISCFTGEQAAAIGEFATHMNFFGIELTAMPKLEFTAAALPLLVFPALSIITMFASQIITMRATGSDKQMQGSMKVMMYLMPLTFCWFCFTVPVAFSLYYTVSNVLMTVQTLAIRVFYDPEKMREQALAEMEAKKKERRRGVKNTTVQVKDEKTGAVTEKNLSASEMNKLRLEYARKLDDELYANERTERLDGVNVEEYIEKRLAELQAAKEAEKKEN